MMDRVARPPHVGRNSNVGVLSRVVSCAISSLLQILMAAPSADRLVAACDSGDLPSVIAAVAAGASVNEKGKDPFAPSWPPLAAAVCSHRHDVVVWLLSHGADPNGDGVMWHGARYGTADILQLLVDAGGDVNADGKGAPLLFWALRACVEAKVRVLLAAPSLDLTVTSRGTTPEDFARRYGTPDMAGMIAKMPRRGTLVRV